MRLWRLTRVGQTALDGAGTSKHGGRYSLPGAPLVNFASEAGLAVLVALRYLPGDPDAAPDDFVLGWTEIDAIPERVHDADGDEAIRDWVTDWLEERRSLLAAVRSQVLPEADVVLMNPLHPDAARVRPLVTRGRSASPSAFTLRRCWSAFPARNRPNSRRLGVDRQREWRSSLPGSSTSGVGALRRELPAPFAAVFCEILIVWRRACSR
jgi:RES domain-containing protein